MRTIIGMLAGIVVATLTISAVELVGHKAYPVPTSVDMRDPAVVTSYIANAPAGALLTVVAGWFLGAAFGGWTARRLSHWPPAEWIVAGLIALGGIYSAAQIPAPVWMQVATVLAPALGGLAAHLVSARRRPRGVSVLRGAQTGR
jgi:hypothetical protein